MHVFNTLMIPSAFKFSRIQFSVKKQTNLTIAVQGEFLTVLDLVALLLPQFCPKISFSNEAITTRRKRS
jgi:hypothetical protein